jgi:hypothetical protein
MNYIIVFPHGGFNDIMNVIHRSYLYALQYNRILIIDNRYNWFKDDIQKYILFNSDIIYKGDIHQLYCSLTNERVYPNDARELLCSHMNKIEIEWHPGSIYYYNSTLLTIDLSIPYSESVIIYSACGGGPGIIELMPILSFTSLVTDVYKLRKSQLPASYISVHIRNTDYHSNVDAFLEKYNTELLGQPIFLASDDKATIDKFRKIYTSDMYSFANIPEHEDGSNIHYHHTTIPTCEFNIDCIVDFLLLINGTKIYTSSEQSGYSKNAVELNKKKHLLPCLNM